MLDPDPDWHKMTADPQSDFYQNLFFILTKITRLLPTHGTGTGTFLANGLIGVCGEKRGEPRPEGESFRISLFLE
jgi:hypothetical protein